MKKKLKHLIVLLFVISSLLILQRHIFAVISNRVEGIVLDKVINQPIEGAAIFLYKVRDDSLGIWDEFKTETDKAGKFKFNDVQKGTYFLRCAKNDYVPVLPSYYYGHWVDDPRTRPSTPFRLYKDRNELVKTINIFRLDDGEIKHFKIAMEKGGKIKGRVSAKFKDGIRGLFTYISVYRKRTAAETFFINDELDIALTTSDKNGFFEINNLPPSDSYYIEIIFTCARELKKVDNIKVKASETTNIDSIIDWTNTTGIKGTIMLDGSIPISTVIRVFSPNNEFVALTYMKKDGNYLLCELEPGKYILEFTFTKLVSNTYEEYTKKIIENLIDGEIKEVNLDIRSNCL